MFRELKEYQDIIKLYQNNVYQSEEDIIKEAFASEEFTEEEAAFIEENFDALIEEVIAEEEESLSEQMTGRQRGKALRQEADKIISDTRKPAVKTTKVSSKAIQGKPAGVVGKFKSALSKVGSKIKDVAKTAVKTGAAPLKSGGAVSKMGAAAGKSGLAVKGAKVLSKMGTAGKIAAGAALAGGALLANRKKIKAAADKAKGEKISKQVDKYVADRKKPINKVKYPVQQGKAEDPKVTTKEPEAKPVKKMGRIEKANRERLGDDRVDALKKKNAEFQAAKKSGNLAQYRKDNPKLSGKERAQAMFKANQAKKKAAAEPKAEVQKKPTTTPIGKPMPSNFPGGVSGKGKATDDFSKDPKYQSTATKKSSTKTNSKFENNPRVKEFRKDVKDLKTTAKYGSTATIQTQDGKEYKPGDAGYEAELKKAKSMVKKSMNREEFTPYDVVLEYLLSSEQVATIEEANYVMTEMDEKTIKGIVDEGLASMALKTGAAVLGGVLAKKGLDKGKKSFDNYLNKQRDKGIGGNTRPGSDKMYYGDKK